VVKLKNPLNRTRTQYANLYSWILCVAGTLTLFNGASLAGGHGHLPWSHIVVLIVMPTLVFPVVEFFDRRELARKQRL